MADKPEKKIDPYDVEALEKSLNDSATRVSTIWVSFLIFSLYLLTAATTVTHRQLFLAEPVKLPVLNIDLPLVGFFFLAPILLVILHIYVLIQVILLARTAATYNEAVDRSVQFSADNARVRQRLANTLFAQIFAGSPSEREGLLGTLLRNVASVTLGIAPVLVLITIQVKFLPYHSHFVTWSHRFLMALDIAAVLALWSGVVARRGDRGYIRWDWKVIVGVSFPTLLSIVLLHFPGEPHGNWLRSIGAANYSWWSPPLECSSPIFDAIYPRGLDRLDLPNLDVVDDDQLEKIISVGLAKKLEPHKGQRTRDFRDRDLRCATLSGADLRRADFTQARMSGAVLKDAELQGAVFDKANLQRSILDGAKLHNVSMRLARLQGADFDDAELQGADLSSSGFQGSRLSRTKLQGAKLDSAKLQGAFLGKVDLRGASLNGTSFEGAYLYQVRFHGADLYRTRLQGTLLIDVQFQGAVLDASLTGAKIIGPYLWRTTKAKCEDAQVTDPHFEDYIDVLFPRLGANMRTTKATPESIKTTIDEIIEYIQFDDKDLLQSKLNRRLAVAPEDKDAALREVEWLACEASGSLDDQSLVNLLLSFACPTTPDRYESADERDGWTTMRNEYVPVAGFISAAIYNVWLEDLANGIDSDARRRRSESFKGPFAERLARGLLGLDDKPCPGASDLDAYTKNELKRYAGISSN